MGSKRAMAGQSDVRPPSHSPTAHDPIIHIIIYSQSCPGFHGGTRIPIFPLMHYNPTPSPCHIHASPTILQTQHENVSLSQATFNLRIDKDQQQRRHGIAQSLARLWECFFGVWRVDRIGLDISEKGCFRIAIKRRTSPHVQTPRMHVWLLYNTLACLCRK